MKYADAVVFDVQIMRKLPRKEPGQVWVFSTMESPNNCHYSMKSWRSVFNWTFTYRRDSDILALYDGFTPRKEKPKYSNYTHILPRKSKDIVWMVSNCKTTSGRQKYVKELRTFGDVDIFGNCGWLKCPRFGEERDCMRRLLNDTYKFYLSFENSLCRDYATEKIFNTAKHDIIPVVRGGYNISLFAPYISYVDANIRKPSVLYGFLKQLSQNNSKYAKYFEWRKHYIPQNPNPNGWCEMCAMLHNQSVHTRLYEDIDKWWWGDPLQSPQMCNYRDDTDRAFETLKLMITSGIL